MSIDTVTTPSDDGPLSPWWLRSIAIVMVIGFSVLGAITFLGYRNAPPIPDLIEDTQGEVLFTGADISGGQAVFLKYGLMDNGSIWGHGGYLGPDFSATALHRMGQDTAAAIAQRQFGQPVDALDAEQKAAVEARTAVTLKTNRYDADTGTLTLTPAEAAAWRQQLAEWTEYFKDPVGNGGLKPGLITDPTELNQFTAFVTWAAWASVANRPGKDYSYTNNFPYDSSVGNEAVSGALLWSALSLIMLLGGISAVLLAFGKFDYLGWISHGHHVHPQMLPGQASPGQRALVKFFVVVALLFLMQTLIGGLLAHYRIEPEGFYGIPLMKVFPSNLMRTWHLQTALFWIITAYVAAGLFLAGTLRADEPRWLAPWTNVLFGAFVVVIGGSLLGIWAGMEQLLEGLWFWIGNQGWEYLELGRVWQVLLIAGLLIWFVMLLRLVYPNRIDNPEARPIVRMFLLASLSIPVFYVPALLFGAETNYTIVDTWRFWIAHLWLEGFFEFFATTVVALIFFQLGLARRNTALRVAYLDAILYFGAGVIGTGHHWYFNGQSQFNMAAASLFTALEVVPLTLLTLDAWDFVRTTRRDCAICGKPIAFPHKWTFYFLMAVGFWNFFGAGVLGFLISLPIISYYEVGTILTPNHAHAALMGVFGMLAIALLVMVLRQVSSDKQWPGIEKYVKVAFFGTNIGLAMMVLFSLLPGGISQMWNVIEHGYWHARSLAYTGTDLAQTLEWLRLPGDLVFIFFGSVPLAIAAIKCWLGLRSDARQHVSYP